MSHAMIADLIFSLSVIYLLILDKIDLCKLQARVDALEKKLAIKSKQSQESAHHPLPFPNDPSTD
jgi:hypothetical protein